MMRACEENPRCRPVRGEWDRTASRRVQVTPRMVSGRAFPVRATTCARAAAPETASATTDVELPPQGRDAAAARTRADAEPPLRGRGAAAARTCRGDERRDDAGEPSLRSWAGRRAATIGATSSGISARPLPQGTSHRLQSAALHRLVADVALATPASKRWCVHTEECNACGRGYPQETDATIAEAARGTARLEKLVE
jgi:hypothetical protein